MSRNPLHHLATHDEAVPSWDGLLAKRGRNGSGPCRRLRTRAPRRSGCKPSDPPIALPKVGYNTHRYDGKRRLKGAVLTATASREYKDRLFGFIFGSPGNEAWTLSLYNAVNGTSYEDPSAVEINTIREALYLGMHNDVSFLIADEVSVYEQQSTYNPNMPLRMLQYAGNLYEHYVVGRGLNKYGRRLLPLPAPRLVVFYNGGEDRPDETVLRLSDSFPDSAPYDLEARVRMVNVNEGRSPGLLAACAPLREYAWLVARVREAAAAGAEVGEAVDRAVTAMPGDFEIRGFLVEHRAEVALEEHFVNVCRYAYAGQDKPGTVQVSYAYGVNPSTITVELRDTGVPFDPIRHTNAESPFDTHDGHGRTRNPYGAQDHGRIRPHA